ncbi:MAG: nitroreductase [Chloroflexota bacterium]
MFNLFRKPNYKDYPETIDLLLTRRSLVAKNHTGPGPNSDELGIILRCATRVPDHAKLTPWHIQVLQDEALTKVGSVIGDVYKADNPDAEAEKVAFESGRLARSPLVLIVSTKIESTERIPRWEQILSGGAVCQNILVAATALGYASQWLSEWYSYDQRFKDALNIAESDEILGIMHIGTASIKPKERARPQLTDVVEYL